MNRRQAAMTFGALWTTLLAPGAVAAQVTPTLTWAPKALTSAQARTLDVVAELIVPATGTPGAREAGVPQFVDRAVSNFCTAADAAAIRSGLDRIEADANAEHGKTFAALSSPQQSALLTRYDAEGRQPRDRTKPPPFFPVLRELVTVGYFTSEPGATKAVRYDPIPGAYRGCVPLKEIGRAWAL
jgi:hypothetical protein